MEYKKLKLILILFHLSSSLFSVKGQLDQICVSLGKLEINKPLYTGDKSSSPNTHFCQDLASTKSPSPGGSIGGSKYRMKRYGHNMMAVDLSSFGIPSNKTIPCLQRKAASEDTLRVSPVRDKDAHMYLSGWLSVGLNIKLKVHWAFIQVSDEDGNAIGEFVNEGGSTLCGNQFSKDVKFGNPHQFLPCSAGGLQEPRVAQAVVYTAKESMNDPGSSPFIDDFLESPDKDNTLKMRFLWRLNEYYCNRHEKFRVVVFYLAGDATSAIPIFMQSDWYFPKWFGVADIAHEGAQLECFLSLSNAIGDAKFWIDRKEPSTSANDNLKPEEEEPGLKTLYKACRTFISRTNKYRANALNQPAFGGRCESKDEKKFKPSVSTPAPRQSSVDVPHGCKKNPKGTYPDNMENYKSYLDKREKHWETVCNTKTTTCPQLDAHAIKAGRTVKIKNKTVKSVKTQLLRFATGRYIKRTRAYHGLTMSCAFLFFIPISNFIARYFKETFLDCDVMGLRLWSVLHVGGSFWAIAMIATALSASTKVSNVYGHSWDPRARQHVNMGWVCFALFILTMLLGPFRPLQPKARSIIMVIHAVLGFANYIIGLYLIVSSTVIPGSPSASICYRNVTEESSSAFTAPLRHRVTEMIIVWLVLDVFFHFIMNRLQLVADHAWNIKRPLYFPLLPIVRLIDTRSFKYFRYRTFFLLLYVGILSIFIALMWGQLYEHDWRECDAGPMTCTHRNNSAEGAYQEIICGRTAKIRALRRENGLD